MAKRRLNRLNKSKQSFDVVLKQWAKKLPYLILIIIIAAVATSLHRSSLFEPKISWSIDEKLTNDTVYYEKLIANLMENKYRINLVEIKEKIESDPWIAKAEVERTYWNKINISLTAHIVAMQWQDSGYISTEGVLFKPLIILESGAPMAVVSEGGSAEFFKDYLQYQTILEPMLISRFERGKIDKLTILPNIGIILGQKKQQQRLKDFVKAYNHLKQTSRKIRERGVFDMRYAKGFALSYQPQ